MANWWDGLPNERYWCEVTGRDNIGADLKAPQKNESGDDYWSYSLIEDVIPGDVVFHYSTQTKAFVGASVAGGPMEHRPIVWAPHGTVGRAKTSARKDRPGYWRPLYGFRSAKPVLPLKRIEESAGTTWLQSWVKAHESAGPLRLPFQLRSDGLRAGQGYLFKLPADFVERWPPLRRLADDLDERAEELSDQVSADRRSLGFRPKSEADYTAVISATVQRRTRTHEKLVRVAGDWFKARGFEVANPHPKDLEIISPVPVIVEAKVVRERDPLLAIREAVGQLHEYRYFIGPRNASLAILLDREPPIQLIRYMEDHLNTVALWLNNDSLCGGPLAQEMVLNVGGRN